MSQGRAAWGDCPSPFDSIERILALRPRESPYWHTLLRGRHIGIYRPNYHVCTWTARYLSESRRYYQKALGPALPGDRPALSPEEAERLAMEWFECDSVKVGASRAVPAGRTSRLNFSPIGAAYTVGHALTDYLGWAKVARSPGSVYNNIVLINHHLVGPVVSLPLEEFSARELQQIAQRIVETSPHHGFSRRSERVIPLALSPDELRRRKRTFNSIVSILRVAFQYAWDSGRILSDRPWRCLKRISVTHTPRPYFLDREECRRLIDHCNPELGMLVLGALYTGCRIGELANLRAEDVGREVYGLHIAAFKRGPARFVFLPDEGMAFFLSMVEGKSGIDRLFLSPKGKVWSCQHTGQFRRAVAAAGLPEAFVFHGLRHTYASDLVRQGVPMEIVARQLGHADSRTVMNTYGHLAEQFREEQIRERFSPLSLRFETDAILRSSEFALLRASKHPVQWRQYGAGLVQADRPARTYLRTDGLVVAAFDRSRMF